MIKMLFQWTDPLRNIYQYILNAPGFCQLWLLYVFENISSSCRWNLIWLALIHSNWNATSRLSHCIWEIRQESWSLQSWHQMPGSRGQSAYINQTELICFTAFSGVLAPVYMGFRLASSGHGGPPCRAGGWEEGRWALASPLTEEYEGDREWGVNVSPYPPDSAAFECSSHLSRLLCSVHKSGDER